MRIGRATRSFLLVLPVLCAWTLALPGCGGNESQTGTVTKDDTQDREARNKAMEDFMKSQGKKK